MENINQQKPLLSFEFADANGEIQPLTFVKPLKVITANCEAEVLPCFQTIQDAVHNGYYAAGFLSYESASAFESAYMVNTANSMPLLWFGIFSEPLKEPLSSNGTYKLTNWNPSVTPSEYDAAIKSIKRSIECGDTYQTNYTIRLTSDFQGDDIAFFAELKESAVFQLLCLYSYGRTPYFIRITGDCFSI